MSSMTDGVLAVSTALAAIAAGGSWFAATRANKTAQTLASIEAARRNLERTPQLDVQLSDTDNSQARLYIYLSGPDELLDLDSVSVAVQDDDRDLGLAHHQERVGGPSKEDLRRFVWGPLRFVPGVDGADGDGRAVAGFPMIVGKGRPLAMEWTRPGHWMIGTTQPDWQKQNANNPVRLRITCRRGEEEWVVTKTISNPGFVEEIAVG